MANAQKMIEERKRSLNAIKGSVPATTTHTPSTQSLKSTSKTLPPILSQTVSNLRQASDDKSRKIAMLQVIIRTIYEIVPLFYCFGSDSFPTF